MLRISRIRYRTKNDLVYASMRKAIIDCILKPGERLLLSNLAKKFEVSEIPVREALKRLQSECFVIEKGSALYVAPLTAEEFLKMLSVRLDMEKIAIQLVATNIKTEEVSLLEEDLVKMKQALDNNQIDDYYHFHSKFHNDCFKFCKVSYLIRALTDAWDQHERGIHFFNLKPWREKPDFLSHKKLCHALAAHKLEEAVKLLEGNRTKAFALYKEKLVAFL